jgi:hypothetical protein
VDTVKRVILISILMICMFAPMSTQAQGAPIGVEIECDQSTININVHPEQNEAIDVSCTVTNTGLVNENINLESDVDGNNFGLILSESSFELEAGGDANFIATFSASPRIEELTADYNITARVVSFGIVDPIVVPLGDFGSTADVGGTVKSLPYSRVDLEVSNPSTRNIEVDEEVNLQFTIFNDGNRMDDLEVIVVNQQEIEDAGFTFVSDPFFRATVNHGASSDQGEIILLAPKEASSEISIQVELRAFSKLDSSAEPSEVTVRIVVAASSGGGGSIGFDTMSEDNMAMIGMGLGGLIGVILLLVVISRLTKKAGKQKTAAKDAKKVAKSARRAGKAGRAQKAKPVEVEEDDIDDDFDDDLDFDDDFDFDDI